MKMQFLSLAIKLAQANETYPKWRFGSVLVKGGSVLAVGQNRLRSAPNHFTDPCSVHAEQDVLKRVNSTKLKGSVLYVARVGANNEPRLAKPCKTCTRLLTSLPLKRTYFTVDKESYGVLL